MVNFELFDKSAHRSPFIDFLPAPQDTFNAFDHAGDGFIDNEKLSHVLSNLGLQFQVRTEAD